MTDVKETIAKGTIGLLGVAGAKASLYSDVAFKWLPWILGVCVATATLYSIILDILRKRREGKAKRNS